MLDAVQLVQGFSNTLKHFGFCLWV